jgi:diacylglycerol kinase (ATP)
LRSLSPNYRMLETAAIVNPASACGRTRRVWPDIAAGLGRIQVRFTQGPGHATQLARELLQAGCQRIVAVGGDGTANEVLNGFLDQDRKISENATLALIPMGTGSDLARSLGIRSRTDAVRVLHNGRPLPMDVGTVRFRDHSGRMQSRYFANMVSFGMGGEVAACNRSALRFLGGKAAFLCTTLRVFLRYRPPKVVLALDEVTPCRTHTIMNIAVGNGRYHGGGMHICPRADMSDGLFEITVLDALGIWILARDLRFLYSPNLYAHPKAHHYRAAKVSGYSAERVMIEVDGEPLGTLPVELKLLPAAIRVWRSA